MKENIVKQLDVKRFNALAGMIRSPIASYISKELKWYSNEDETILGTLLIDMTDDDYASIVLKRDEGGKFRAYDHQVNFATISDAQIWIINTIKFQTAFGNYNHHKEEKTKRLDLFSSIVPLEKQHPIFVRLNRENEYLSAKQLISEIISHFKDIDGNFVEQFQSTGFESRLWELYLNSYLHEEELFIDRSHSSPDFIVKKFDKQVAIEAVIVGRKSDNPDKYFKLNPYPKIPTDIAEKHENSMPIKFGSPLFSKLQKKYWELSHVKNLPLIFAIADFHDDQSMLWSSTALINYLYGVKHDYYHDKDGKLIIVPEKIESHKVNHKEIPSGFFFQENAENISGIMFSQNATLSKFNRLGKEAGFGNQSTIMIRQGLHHDHNPDSSVPLCYRYLVDTNTNETWADGLSLYHNPNALHPIPKELFPSAAHHYFKDGQIISNLPEFFPYMSITHIIVKSK